jgi:hypothetical protein
MKDERLLNYVIGGSGKIRKSDCMLNDFEFMSKPEIIFEEINIVMRGVSFLSSARLDCSLPTFQVNIYGKNERFPNGVGITADGACFQRMHDSGVERVVRIVVDSKLNEQTEYEAPVCPQFAGFSGDPSEGLTQDTIERHSQHEDDLLRRLVPHLSMRRTRMPDQLSLGSGLCAVVALRRVSDKVNIFGWDEYLEKSICGLPYVKVLWELGGPKSKNIFKTFCSQLLAWNYAVGLTLDPKCNLHSSFLAKVAEHGRVTERIKRHLYQNEIQRP